MLGQQAVEVDRAASQIEDVLTGGFGVGANLRSIYALGASGFVLNGSGSVVVPQPRPISEIAYGPVPFLSRGLVQGIIRTGRSDQLIVESRSSNARLSVEVIGPVRYPNPAQPFIASTGVLVVGIPLAAVDASLSHLEDVELVIVLGALALLGILGYVVVRVGIRPLVEIESTAEAIAAGDLTRRVRPTNPSTEIGRLGASLNTMLTRIEESFRVQQESESRLRRFVADASHELRTPVTSIRGYAELFRRGARNRPEDLALAMRRIEDEAIRMATLVEDLLLLARLDQGRPLRRELVDLSELTIDGAADAQVIAPDRQIDVIAPPGVQVVGDEERLRQIIGNLLQNALRYTPQGSPIEVVVTARESWATLEVRDHGPGIASEHVERIFERFYRADESRTRGVGGTGLGLSIVQSIAAAHGGRALVQTQEGEGATFIVELPLAVSLEPGKRAETE